MKGRYNFLIAPLACFLLAFTFMPAYCLADTVALKNGDVLTGRVLTPAFELSTPYGGISVAATRIRSIRMKQEDNSVFILQTINNDLFSGVLLENGIDITLNTGATLPVTIDRVSAIVFDRDKPTAKINTTVFFMKNKDRFSGKLLNKALHIRTDHELLGFKASDFSLIIFNGNKKVSANTLVSDKTSVVGILMENQLKIEPESVSLIAPCVGYIEKIQFNAEKLVADKSLAKGIKTFDSDGDGVPDTIDKCPETICIDQVDEKGCPILMDSDKDGVPDKKDACPGTPKGLTVDSNGCWVMYMTNFSFDRFKIQPKYFEGLDFAAGVMKSNPEIRAEIQGHTDNKGTTAYNHGLSIERARAVVAYLVKKGVPEKQIKAVGYGFDRPLQSNDTEEGRAQNRRVQIQQIP
ncbi:MAG: OmpA family protein [Deltaproteobacteria bacterium]|nr:OmpA family protein [Deltaproteobacteria bacterium]